MFRRERNVITLALPRARPHGICMSRAARDYCSVEKRVVHRSHVTNKGLHQYMCWPIYTTTGPVNQDTDLRKKNVICDLE